jgi:hypothetical protein
MKQRKPPRDEAKELQDQARLAKAWRAFHAEELKEALAGPHGAVVSKTNNRARRDEHQ